MSDDRPYRTAFGSPLGQDPAWRSRLPPESAPTPGPDLKTFTWIVHLLYALAMVTGITGIAGVIIAYLKRAEARGTIYESHLDYAIRTFWIGLILVTVGVVLSFVLIGLLVFALAGVWWLIRVIRPILALLENRPISNPAGFI